MARLSDEEIKERLSGLEGWQRTRRRFGGTENDLPARWISSLDPLLTSASPLMSDDDEPRSITPAGQLELR